MELLEKPKIETWMDEKQITLRKNAKTYLKQALENGILPATDISQAKVFPSGIASVVFKVDSERGVLVVKMRNDPGVLESEALFFQEWEKHGVITPKIFNTFTATEDLPVSINVMEFIEAPVISDVFKIPQVVETGLAREIGKISARMHKAHGQGFGTPILGDEKRGFHQTFTEQMDYTLFKKRIHELLNAHHIEDEEVDLAKASVQIIEKELADGVEPSLLHYDLITPHIFYTQPLIIFDPVGLISHPAICLSMSLFRLEQYMLDHPEENTAKAPQEIISGYREEGIISNASIAAGITLNALMVMSSINRRSQPDSREKIAGLKKVIYKFY